MTTPSSPAIKSPKTSAKQQEDSCRTLQPIDMLMEAKTLKKRPFEATPVASKVAALRSIKRRLEDSSTARKRRAEARGIECRVTTRTKSSEQRKILSPMLLEESKYWLLLRARDRGHFDGKRSDLDAFDAVVADIAQDPTTLTPKLLQDLPKALGACQCAITLRQHVALFFADQDRGHQHFLTLLRRWLDTLKYIEVAQGHPIEEELRRFENCYQVLEVVEDYLPDEETFIKDKGAINKSKAERKELFDEAFAQDLQMEVVCYFMELEELVEGVFSVYDQVKNQEKPVMEATVVATLALRMANQLTATLQLRYPTLKLAEDLIGVLVCYPSAGLAARITKAVKERRASFEETGTFEFVPGTLLHDFTSVLTNLAPLFPPIEECRVIALPDGFFGPNYGEERTLEYVLPDVTHCVVLLAQQLPFLYTMTVRKIAAMGREIEGRTGLVVDFLLALEDYFVTRKVTIQLVFLCIAGCSRSLHCKWQTQNDITRANPLVACSQMMPNHLDVWSVGSSHLPPTCRGFCQLYNALVQQGFMENIPFFDDMLEIYEEKIFTPSSRATTTRGSYNKVYLMSLNWSGSSIDATYESASADFKHVTDMYRKTSDDNVTSLTYQLIEGELSFLKGASSKSILKKAADISTKEVFESRILSRDLITLEDDIMDAFSDMCNALGRQKYRDEYIANAHNKLLHDVKARDGLERSVLIPLLALMDALRSDGSVDSSAVLASMRAAVGLGLDGNYIQRSCKAVAAIINARFATPSHICEERYFTFPSGPDFVNRKCRSRRRRRMCHEWVR
ncbi:hypothetical protein F441_01973 [Phytophthora nicotianae CJ01A1]|uniref:DUF6604 domain-containing protein n=1 Tax=Phytophthora nicotianae CJ01A1 TaxID=1317063 RepID=W2XR20_PHYNI|nr:hypothetical protein F441_01973 [Phytophthora nicotianae CJ01A1]